ncbi:MAG: tRNA (adenosine(37)-N6)-dimethylallyltransferase MiaA [Pseudomonadota bacterium]
MTRSALLVIAGPTASGKSGLALDLAERIGGTIVNADSMQVYRDLRVLTARPDPGDEARAPHRLFGHIDGVEACSAARWAAEAKVVLAQVERPILVGGTGLYLRTLLDGIAPVPAIDPAIRAEVRALPVAEAYRRLKIGDPGAAARLAPADATRVARALEVVLSSGRPLTDWQRERVGGIGDRYAVAGLVLTPDRTVLDDQIVRRVDAMLATGALDEVAALTARGLDPALPVMRAIGVAPLAAHLVGTLTRTAALAQIALDTRRYAKRQDTWFRHQAPAEWLRTGDQMAALALLDAAC